MSVHSDWQIPPVGSHWETFSGDPIGDPFVVIKSDSSKIWVRFETPPKDHTYTMAEWSGRARDGSLKRIYGDGDGAAVAEPKADLVALFDLDGTLADFDRAMRTSMEALAPVGEKAYYEEQDEEPVQIRERRRLVKRQPGWWADLPRFQLGFDVLQITRDAGFRTMVLSKGPRSNPTAWGEKIEWCRAHLPADIGITLTEDKGLVYGRILVDDWVRYVERWLEWRPRGLVIMPAHDRNKDFKHPNVVRYDGTNLAEVTDRVAEQKERSAGEEPLLLPPRPEIDDDAHWVRPIDVSKDRVTLEFHEQGPDAPAATAVVTPIHARRIVRTFEALARRTTFQWRGRAE